MPWLSWPWPPSKAAHGDHFYMRGGFCGELGTRDRNKATKLEELLDLFLSMVVGRYMLVHR